MSPENRRIVIEAVKEAGAHLEGRLPPHPGLQKRNPWAHLYERLQAHYGHTYKEVDDSKLDEVLELVRYYRENPC